MKTKPELIIGILQERCDQLHKLLDEIVVLDNNAPDEETFCEKLEPLLLRAREFLEAEGRRKAKGGI